MDIKMILNLAIWLITISIIIRLITTIFITPIIKILKKHFRRAKDRQ